MFVSYDKTAKVEQPTDGAFDSVSPFVSSHRAAILGWRTFAIGSVRTDQLDSLGFQSRPQRIAVGRQVIQQAFGFATRDPSIDQVFNQRHFVMRGAGDHRGQGNSVSVDEQHDLGPFAFLGLANLGAPFFAGLNVPSAIASSQSIPRSRSSFPSRRFQASWNAPDAVHCFNRLQHVLGDGKCVGKSCHRAPVFKTHKMPSMQGRGGTRGRPPFGEGSGSANKSAMISHCSWVSCGLGSVLDPVVLRPRRGHISRVSFMRVPPFTRIRMQFACQTVQ